MACLDTTILLDLRGRGGKKLQERARGRVLELASAGKDPSTTILNLAELRVGVDRAEDPEEEEKVAAMVAAPLRVLGYDRESARTFARITAHLQGSGEPAGGMGVLIASVALENRERLVTRDRRHVAGIPGLPAASC
jgi:tRNA(fMet)-specific endonuclease VapC